MAIHGSKTLLNIVKLRYGDFPVFVEIAQVIAGYQLQTTVAAGFSAQNYINTAVGGSAAVGAAYIDRQTQNALRMYLRLADARRSERPVNCETLR